MKHISRRRHLGPCLAFLGLALASVAPALAQPLTPIGPLVGVDFACSDSATVVFTEGEILAVWKRVSDPTGVYARKGPNLQQLEPRVQLMAGGPIEDIRVVPVPGGFAAAWVRFTPPQLAEAVFQVFGADFTPSSAEVVVGEAALSFGTPALLADENGLLTVAFYGHASTPRMRRFTPTGVPLTPLIEVDPLVPRKAGGPIRLAAGDDGFLVAWEGALPAQSSGLWVRAFDAGGVPAAASVRVAGLSRADFDIAWAEDEYLAAVRDGNVWGYRIDVNGTPTAAAGLLAPAVDPFRVQLAAADDALWLSFIETGGGLYASRIELPGLAVLEDPQYLGPQPGTDFLAKASLLPTPSGGLIATWQTSWGSSSPIPDPCDFALAIHAQEFGTTPLVDVPTLPPPGLFALALALAAGGLLLLRR